MENHMSTLAIGTPEGPSTFLKLPFELRRRVYELAGLVRCTPIDLSGYGYEPTKKVHGCWYAWEGRSFSKCRCPPPPVSLMYTSKFVSREFLSLLYAENHFMLCRGQPGGLMALTRLAPESVASLRTLTVRLNGCSYHNQLEFSGGSKEWCRCLRSSEDETRRDVLVGTSPHYTAARRDWLAIVERLSVKIRPSQLDLRLVCDVKDCKIAETILLPLQKLPRLRHCSIRLSLERSEELLRLAEETVRKVVHPTELPLRAPESLAIELRRHIISFADFEAPSPIGWEPTGRLRVQKWSCGCRFCAAGFTTCIATWKHAAASSACTCRRSPFPLFLVNKAWRAEALRHSYQRNHFYAGHQLASLDQAFVCDFFQSLLEPAWRLRLPIWPHIRSFECIFNRNSCDYRTSDPDGREIWRQDINFMIRELNVQRLTLIVSIEDDLIDRSVPKSVRRAIRHYKALIEPMAALSGLKDFFLRIHIRGDDDDHDDEQLKKVEEMLQKMVKGEDYDAIETGRTPARRHWVPRDLDDETFSPLR